MKNIEIELRYQVADPSQLTAFLSSLYYKGTKRVIDVYLDTMNADLIRMGVYVRVRNNAQIDIKFNRECLLDPNLELQPYCEEYSFALPLREEEREKLNAILRIVTLNPITKADFTLFKQINELVEHRIVDKTRTSYSHEDFTISLDEVAHLGTFLEIELMASDTQNLVQVKTTMSQLLAELNLQPLKSGYDSLILRKQNFAQYLQGRFVLEEDKKYRTQQF
jgi:adenylate cyclase class IV